MISAMVPDVLAGGCGPAQGQGQGQGPGQGPGENPSSNSSLVWQPVDAVALGSGCSTVGGDTMIITMGNDVSIVMDRLAVRLPAGGSDTALAALENCSVRVPLTVPAGTYVDQVTHTLRYGVTKTANSSARMTTLATFMDMPVESFTVDVPIGALENQALTATGTTPLSIACSTSDVSGLFRADVAISGSRASESESLVIGATPENDLRLDITLAAKPCQ